MDAVLTIRRVTEVTTIVGPTHVTIYLHQPAGDVASIEIPVATARDIAKALQERLGVQAQR